jgi:hypothetical protein
VLMKFLFVCVSEGTFKMQNDTIFIVVGKHDSLIYQADLAITSRVMFANNQCGFICSLLGGSTI